MEVILVYAVTQEYYVTLLSDGEPVASVNVEDPCQVLRPGVNGERIAGFHSITDAILMDIALQESAWLARARKAEYAECDLCHCDNSTHPHRDFVSCSLPITASDGSDYRIESLCQDCNRLPVEQIVERFSREWDDDCGRAPDREQP